MPTLEWIGKDKVINHHQEVPFRILDKKYTFNAENSENMIIHGDNLLALNKALNTAFEKTNALYQGKFLEKTNEVILPCVYHLDVCRINLKSLNVVSLENLKNGYKRKARLLEPYINIVTEKFSTYISSKGTMRIPDSLLTHKYIYKNTDEE